MGKGKFLQTLKDYAMITAGCILYSFSFVFFFDTNAIPLGGFSGIAQTIKLFIPGLPVGLAVLVLNLPLIAIGIKKQGLSLLFCTAYSIAFSSAVTDSLTFFFDFPSTEPLLATIFGGGLMGVALGIMLLKNATTGGTELAARLLKYVLRGISIGKICLVIDVTVVCIFSIFSKGNSFNSVMYGVISMYVCSITMDMVVYGQINAKLLYIVSSEHEKIKNELIDMGIGITFLDGRGGYTDKKTDVILCAIRPSKMGQVKKVVSRIDPERAFIIVSDAKEVFGEGFGGYSEEYL